MRIAQASASTLLPSPEIRRWASGIVALDAALAGGLAYGRVHEIYAAEAADSAAAAGFGLALATAMSGQTSPLIWLRSRRAVRAAGGVQASGWADLGGTPGRGIVGILPDAVALLRAAADALRCAELGAVIVEDWGRLPELDLTASRRLALAAERSGVPLFLLRNDAVPVPSAAQTRWQVAAAPSRALPGQAVGAPVFAIKLLRQRSGPCGLGWCVEWDRDRCIFRETTPSGAVVSAPVRRPAAATSAGIFPQSGRRAA